MEILIKRLDDNAKLPAYGREVGPGIDLSSLHEVTLEPGASVQVSTGIAVAMPVGYIGFIWSQTPMTINDPIKVTESIVDSGYRDEVIIELTNTSGEARTIAAGEVIAQLLVQQIHRAHLIEAEDVSGGV